MATNYNITMKRYNGTDYDVLYPRTLPSQIDGGVYTKDEATGLFLSKTGGQMSGLLDMNGNKISNLDDPTDDFDAATKSYVDGNQSMIIKDIGAVSYDGSSFNDLLIQASDIQNILGFYIVGTITIKQYTNPDYGKVSIYFGNSIYTGGIPLYETHASIMGGQSVAIRKVVYFNNSFDAVSLQDGTVDSPGYTFIGWSGKEDQILYSLTSGVIAKLNYSTNANCISYAELVLYTIRYSPM